MPALTSLVLTNPHASLSPFAKRQYRCLPQSKTVCLKYTFPTISLQILPFYQNDYSPYVSVFDQYSLSARRCLSNGSRAMVDQYLTSI